MFEHTTSTYWVWQTHAERQPACTFLPRSSWQLLGDPQIYLLFHPPTSSSSHSPILSTASLLLCGLAGWTSQQCTAGMIQEQHFYNDVVKFFTLLRSSWWTMGGLKNLNQFESQSRQHHEYHYINILMSALEDSLRTRDVFYDLFSYTAQKCVLFFTVLRQL